MNCVYIRQLSDSSPEIQLQRSEDFKESAAEPYYKNIVRFTSPADKEESLYISSVGYEVAPPDKSLSIAPPPTQTTFYYVLGGGGYFNGTAVRKGDCCFAEAGKPYSIAAKGEEGFRFCWITLSHTSANAISSLGFTPSAPVFRYNFEAELRQIIFSIQNVDSKTCDVCLFTLGKFLEILSRHKASAEQSITEKLIGASHLRYVSLMKSMLEDSGYRVSIEEIAKTIGFSRKYLSMIFYQTTGETLRDYILKHKMERAKSMLIDGELSPKAIAFQLNYNDYSSFSRAFRKECGMTPHEFMAANK